MKNLSKPFFGRIAGMAASAFLFFSCAGQGEIGLGTFRPEEPASITLCSPQGEITRVGVPYRQVRKKDGRLVALAEIESGGAVFHFMDTWVQEKDELVLEREVCVEGTVPEAGFFSEIAFCGGGGTPWKERDFLIPGIIYGKPHTSAGSKGGSQYHDAGFFSIREDYLSAPLVISVCPDGSWIGLLNPAPDGSTTWEETTAGATDTIIDGRLAFGALGLREKGNDLEISFRYPGTCEEFPARGFFAPAATDASPVMRGRFHPVEDGFEQYYTVRFRQGKNEGLPAVERTAWRWAWDALHPKIEPVDVDQVRRTLLDHLQARVIRYQGRAGVPFVIDAQSGRPGSFRPAAMNFRWGARPAPDTKEIVSWGHKVGVDVDPAAAELNIWPWAVVGFCGKHVELAGQFLRESYQDGTVRGAAFRQSAEEIMNTLVTCFPVDPPIGEGLDLRTGKAGNIHGGHAFGIRPIAEDMSMLIELLQAEKEHGRGHDDWLAWGLRHAEWLLGLQRGDGTFPADWDTDGNISDAGPEKTWAPIPFFTRLSAFTGEKKWLEAACRAGDALWKVSGEKGVYCGATGSTQVADKESGMLALNAFLSLFESTGDEKWLKRAVAAADYTESWIWIWNVPMPEGTDSAGLGWKPGVPTTGVNGIGSNDIGGVDQYLDWAVPLYAKLYKYTGDNHYYDVARILLHGTKAMLALPGRSYDLAGPGWQQEHWRMGPVRGIGAHRTWLPWISINHLHGITALEDFSPELYERMKQ